MRKRQFSKGPAPVRLNATLVRGAAGGPAAPPGRRRAVTEDADTYEAGAASRQERTPKLCGGEGGNFILFLVDEVHFGFKENAQNGAV